MFQGFRGKFSIRVSIALPLNIAPPPTTGVPFSWLLSSIKGSHARKHVFRWYEAEKYNGIELKATALYYLENRELFRANGMFKRISIEAAMQIEDLISSRVLPRFKTGQRLLPGVKPYVSKQDAKFKNHAIGKYKHEAVIYRIKALFGDRAGEYYIGISHDSEKRWSSHIFTAINPHERNYDLADYICLALEDLGYEIHVIVGYDPFVAEIFKIFGINKIYFYEEYFKKYSLRTIKDKAENYIQHLSAPDILKLSRNGMQIGKYAASSFMRQTRKSNFNLEDREMRSIFMMKRY